MYAAVLVCLLAHSTPRDAIDQLYDRVMTPEGQAQQRLENAQQRQANALARQADAMESIPIALMTRPAPWYESDGVLIGGAVLVVGILGVVVLRGALKRT